MPALLSIVIAAATVSDPGHNIPWPLVNEFTHDRVLTVDDAQFTAREPQSDGTVWLSEATGPFRIHVDHAGRILEAPQPVSVGGVIQRLATNPLYEEQTGVRLMRALDQHRLAHGGHASVVFSPWHVLLKDGVPDTVADTRQPPGGVTLPAELPPASSELFAVDAMHRAGFQVVVWTVNDAARMRQLISLGVDGIISDRPDILRVVMRETGVDPTRFDAQAHRGGRNLRPENTLPAMESGLDELMTTLETDVGITRDGFPILSHDPHLQATKCRKVDGSPYETTSEALIKDHTLADLQSTIICDKLLNGRESQRNDRGLSPVSVAFAKAVGLVDPYTPATLAQLYAFTKFYARYYAKGDGSGHPEARLRAANARRIRFNVETKINPRRAFADRTVSAEEFTKTTVAVIRNHGMLARTTLQSFDLRTLILAQQHEPRLRTVCLIGDFPVIDGGRHPASDDGTNLQDEDGQPSPWLAGIRWPYRFTYDRFPPNVAASEGRRE